MSLNLSYPGVYIQEVDPGVRTIVGVPTSITAFVGRARRGPVDDPTRISSFADYARTFGGLWEGSSMSYAVRHFFLNGGADAIIVRVHNPSAQGATDTAPADLPGENGGPALHLAAANPGTWANNVKVFVDYGPQGSAPLAAPRFNLLIQEVDPADPTKVVAEERFIRLDVDAAASSSVKRVLEQQSNLVRVLDPLPPVGVRPAESAPQPDPPPAPGQPGVIWLTNGLDGVAVTAAQVTAPGLAGTKQGIYALDRADLFNLLCIPPYDRDHEVANADWAEAAAYCLQHRAVLLVDGPSAWNDPAHVITGLQALKMTASMNAAVYFPWIRVADPMKQNLLVDFPPSGAIAGVIARTDANRGIWKSPAGLEASVAAQGLTVRLNDSENGRLNPLGVNCLRSFPNKGRVVWGARTMDGADELASQWKYLAVRRVALYIEESLYRGTQWVVFEPNDERLWSQIRLNLGSFMHDLFRQGAFQGISPREAYFVKCDSETTQQSDIDRGIVNILVGFAPLKPAEFVVIKIQQIVNLKPES